MYNEANTVVDDKRVVVVGSGPAGAAATLFLHRAGVEVLLLEAGPLNRSFGVTARVAGVTIGKIRRELRTRRDLRMTGDPTAELYEELAPGGLSNHWSCAVPRFSPDDFRDAARAGETYTWPIDYAELSPWYDRVEPLLHISGSSVDVPQLPSGKVRDAWDLTQPWRRVADKAASCGRSVVPMPYAYGAGTTLTLSGNAFNAFTRVVKPLLRRPGVSARFGARVVRLEWSARTRRVNGVVFFDETTQREERVECDAVVLAAGAINTAQVLLQSSSAEFPDGLGNTHGVLGRYFHDHPLGKLVVDLGESIPLRPPVYVTRRSLERADPLYDAACMQWSGVQPLAQSVLRGKPGKVEWVGFSVFGTMAPTSEDRLELDASASARNGTRSMTLHTRHPEQSRSALEAARDDLLASLDAAGLRPRMRSWEVEIVGNSVHYGGTCRMHASPRFGMLDAWSRLHAVPNVVVADASAFTTGPEKNPVLTAMALAARASDKLGRELKNAGQ